MLFFNKTPDLPARTRQGLLTVEIRPHRLSGLPPATANPARVLLIATRPLRVQRERNYQR